MNRIKMTLNGSKEIYTAPQGYNLEASLKWLASLYHPCASKSIKPIGSNTYQVSNGRRGINYRGTTITVLSDIKG
jgi:hypothetical protein